MKKNVLFSLMALLACLFTACSQEEIVSDGGQADNKVKLFVAIPAVGPAARTADLNVDSYAMRCIMELIDDKGVLIAGSRQVVVVTDGKASFEFAKPAGDYTCVFWADYVKGTDITNTKATVYSAESLAAVGYRLNKTSDLFNNKAADAFCGKLTSGNISTGIKVTLKRPFARIAIAKTELNKLGEGLNQFTASINGATGYNVATGKTATPVTLNQTSDAVVTVPADGDLAFYCFTFPMNDAVTKVSNIAFTKDGDENSKKGISITAEQMKEMKNNTAYNLTVDENGGDTPSGDVKVEIEVDNSFGTGGGTTEPETPAGAPTVGNYLYADGTWGTDATNAVAIVFHVGANEKDKSVYSSLAKVNGYAVALTDATTAGLAYAAAAFPSITITGAEQDPKDNYSGYLNSHLTADVNGTAYNQLAPVAAALNYSVTLTAGKTSGWYLPTVAQLEDIRSLTTIDAKFAAANYWSCVIATSGKPFYASFDPADTANYGGTNKATGATAKYNVRAIVTF